MPLTFAAPHADALPLYLIGPEELDAVVGARPSQAQTWITAQGFAAGAGQVAIMPGTDGAPIGALVGLGPEDKRARHRFTLASARAQLPDRVWALATDLEPEARDEAALGWLLAGYRFARYAKAERPKASLVAPDGVDAPRLEAIAAAEALTRDLINTPAEEMGPAELEGAARALATAFGARIDVITDAALLDRNFPLIHTVGRAADAGREPRLIDLNWGQAGPRLTLVGKGVCFDTGGLNLKPGSSMGLMKKDMGGAATVLGLAHMIMATQMPCRLRVLIPAVENAVSGPAFRPGDIFRARNGLSVEVNNTDAEGRLVLADALALGAEDAPDLMVSIATLTGAARVAVGPDLAPFFCDDEDFATQLATSAAKVRDPVWRLPFWTPYEEMIEPGIADLDNAPGGGFAGAITAALFLRRFAGGTRYAHFDVYGWQPKPAPGRPKGGVGMGARALFDALPQILA